ncbi:hypothetical protein [Pyrobaculum neutrophilum]|nr:hypothetical protein [Pyrobaculum neutrophilum]
MSVVLPERLREGERRGIDVGEVALEALAGAGSGRCSRRACGGEVSRRG